MNTIKCLCLEWSVTGNMTNGRVWHTASVLSNGKVLVTGGFGNLSFLNSAELYDPSTGTWTTTGSMNNVRGYHTASVLSNGKVLVTGGIKRNTDCANGAELYDPLTDTWITISSMTDARYSHRASILSNGKVLITGGFNYPIALNSAELYELFQTI